MDTKLLALDEEHRRYGRMGTWRGWDLPMVFSNVEAEFEAANTNCALVDVSYCGRIAASGKDVIDLLQRLTTNDLHHMGSSAGVAETTFTSEKGRVLDLVTIVVAGDILLITSPGSEEMLRQWIDKYCITEDIRLKTVTDETVAYYLLGPRAIPLASSLFSVSLSPGRSAVTADGTVRLAALEDAYGSRVLLVTSLANARKTWSFTATGGREHGLLRMGFDAFEAYRIGRGIPGSGSELTAEYNPWEVGLGSTISLTKGCYLGQEVVARLETYQKIKRKLTGVVFSSLPSGSAAPLPLEKGGDEVGTLTSVTRQAIRGKFLGLGVVRADLVSEGDSLSVSVESTLYHGVALTPPILT